MKYKLSKYCIISKYSIEDKNNTKLVYSTRTGEIILLKNKTLENIEKGYFSKIDEGLLDKLIFSEILIPYEEDELETILDEFTFFTKDSKSLGMVITPSANCQLGCEYCGQIHSNLNLSDDLSNKIVNHIKEKFKEKEYDELSITWYGSEPLMGLKNIEKLSNDLIELCKKTKKSYFASMITNGLNLNDRTFKKLVNYKVTDFQITIDGIKETHDKSRYTKKGLPTFDIIFDNIKNAVKSDVYTSNNVNITIRINVHLNNYKDVDKLLFLLYDEKIHDKVFVSFAPVHDWGNNSANDKIGLSLQKFSELEIDWFIKMKELNFKEISLIPSRLYTTCMTTTGDSELIDAKGNISYCWEVPYTPDFEDDKNFVIGNLNKKNKYSNKNYRDSPLRNWYDDIALKKYNSAKCHSCEFLPVCGGGCPISWYKNIPACPSYKLNIEDRLFMHYINEKTKKNEKTK